MKWHCPMWPKMRNNGNIAFPLFSANNEGNAMIRQHFFVHFNGLFANKIDEMAYNSCFFHGFVHIL